MECQICYTRNNQHHDFDKNKKNYPGLDILIFFKLVSLIFPTSDFRHPVTIACAIFMSEILLECRIKNEIDISKDLFILTLILDSYILYKYDGKKQKTV
ncbi:nucleolar protein 14 homolog [Bombus bifarius]|uniref:Nucleolar protein 14 homolog n=1 Tax=Bombus bifarius TaxID=103933 RepID=A0A6P8MWB4_9HYME|nr:nucleolar protein 14 homolog [Bombus bifarius]